MNIPIYLDYSSTTLQYRPDVAATGTNVHVAWSEYDGYEGVYSIYYSKSENRGVTWSSPINLDDGSSGGRYGATIASNGNDVVAAWIDTWTYDIYTVSSSNNGDSWTSPQIVESADSSLSYMPELIFNAGKFHMVWTSTATGESVQYSSSDDGNDWSDAIFIYNVQKIKKLNDKKILKLSLLSLLYGSVDLTYFCLAAYDEKNSTTFAKDFMSKAKN